MAVVSLVLLSFFLALSHFASLSKKVSSLTAPLNKMVSMVKTSGRFYTAKVQGLFVSFLIRS